MMQIVGRAIFGTYPEPTRYYAELRAVDDPDPSAITRPEDAIVCTLPCCGPGQAIADGRKLYHEMIGA